MPLSQYHISKKTVEHVSSDRVFLGVTIYVHVFLDKSGCDRWYFAVRFLPDFKKLLCM